MSARLERTESLTPGDRVGRENFSQDAEGPELMSAMLSGIGFCATREDMCPLVRPRHFRGLGIVSLLALTLAFPVGAQTNSQSRTQSTSTADTRAQSESKRGPPSSNPTTPKTGSNSVTKRTKIHSTAARVEAKTAGTLPKSNPKTKKQTSSESRTQNTTADTQAQPESKRGPTSSNPTPPKTGSNSVTKRIKTNSIAVRTEPESAGTAPKPNAGIKKQSSSESRTQSAGTASTGAQSESKRGPTSSNPTTPKTESDSITLSTTTNSTAARSEPTSAATLPESNTVTKKAGSAVLINIDKTKQTMTVFLDGIEKYSWPVSTGKAGYSTPSGTYTATSMNEIWYSKQWDNAPMPHSIFFIKDGHAIHGSYEVKNLGRPVSHGCVRISPENATTLYALVQENGLQNTQVALTGVTPGGEYKVASPASPRYGQEGSGWYEPGDNYYSQPRPGFFGQVFGGPYYNGPQGYYRPPAYYQPRGY